MAITISGENNNDRITATDGVIDTISGFNIAGIITASSFTGDLTGDVTGNLTGNVTGNINNTTLLLQTGGTERIRITSSGSVLIGSSTNTGHTGADDLLVANDSGHAGITIRSGSSHHAQISFADGTSGNAQYMGQIIYNHASDYLYFRAAGPTERLRLDSDGARVSGALYVTDNIVLSDALRHTGDMNTQIRFPANDTITFETASSAEVLRIDSSGRLLVNTTTTYVSNQIMIVKGASPSAGGNRPYDGQLAIEGSETNGAINTGGVLAFIGHSGVGSRGFGSIRCLKENGTSGQYGSYMSFETRTNGTAPAEKLRITSAGYVGINQTSPDYELDVTGRIGFTQQIRGASGSQGTPAYAFDGDHDTGMFRNGVNNLCFGTAGIQRLTIDENGKLGLGVNATNPTYQLQIHESDNTAYAANATVAQLAVGNVNSSSATNAAGIHLFTDGNGRGLVNLCALNNSTNSSADFVIQTRHSATTGERLRITSGGDIGVGIDAPVSRLQINSTRNAETDRHTAAHYHLALRNPEDDTGESIGLSFGITSNATKVGAAILHERDGGGSQGSLQFYTSGDGNSLSERLRITKGGSVGINQSSPYYKLQLNFTNNTTSLSGGGSGNWGGDGIRIENDSTTAGAMALAHFRVHDADWHIGNKFNSTDNSDFVFNHEGNERLRIDSSGRLLINSASSADTNNFLEVHTTYGGRMGFARNDTSTSAGNNLGTLSFYGNDSNGTFQESARIEANADLDHATGDKPGRLVFYTTPDGGTTPAERLRIGSNGYVNIGTGTAEQQLTVQNSAQHCIIRVISKNTHDVGIDFGDTDDTDIAGVRYSNSENSLRLNANAATRLKIDSGGRTMIGGGSSPTKVGDGRLIVYSTDRLHPAIKPAGTSNSYANGYSMIGDNYAATESQVNLGVSYSSAGLVLSRGVKVSGSQDDTYLSSQAQYATRPCAIKLDSIGAFNFLTTETNATTAVDSAVTLTEVFKIDRVGNVYQKISGRNMYLGASGQLRIGVQSNGDPNIEAVNGDLKLMKGGSTIMQLRSDGFEMKQDIYFSTAGKGIVLGNTSNVNANTLDDYEEGTYSITMTGESGGSATLSNNYGVYTKIGRLVTVHMNVIVSNKSNLSGVIRISLPFTVAGLLSGTSLEASGIVGYFANLASASSHLGLSAVEGSTTCQIRGVVSKQVTTATTFGANDITNSFELRGTLSYFV